MSLVIVESRRCAVLDPDVIEQLLLVRSAPRAVRHLEPAVLARPVAVHVEGDEHIREITLRYGRRNEIDDVAVALQQIADPDGNVLRDTDLGVLAPARAGLDLEPAQLRRHVVGLPMADLDADATRARLDRRRR